MKYNLNLGCGLNKMAEHINVDKHGTPDVLHDLETFPWPWPKSAVEEVVLNHVLEHLGRDPDVFIQIMCELYRVCCDGATVRIAVPHPRHENFLNDPTHVRPVTPAVMTLFSRKECDKWVAGGYANSPLALYHGVDFELENVEYKLDERWKAQAIRAGAPFNQIHAVAQQAMLYNNNVVEEIQMILRVIKP